MQWCTQCYGAHQAQMSAQQLFLLSVSSSPPFTEQRLNQVYCCLCVSGTSPACSGRCACTCADCIYAHTCTRERIAWVLHESRWLEGYCNPFPRESESRWLEGYCNPFPKERVNRTSRRRQDKIKAERQDSRAHLNQSISHESQSGENSRCPEKV